MEATEYVCGECAPPERPARVGRMRQAWECVSSEAWPKGCRLDGMNFRGLLKRANADPWSVWRCEGRTYVVVPAGERQMAEMMG
jgi:hypothetical protein